jgi:hypothetical protein
MWIESDWIGLDYCKSYWITVINSVQGDDDWLKGDIVTLMSSRMGDTEGIKNDEIHKVQQHLEKMLKHFHRDMRRFVLKNEV